MKLFPVYSRFFLGLFCFSLCCNGAIKNSSAQDSEEDLAKKLANPVASLISFPIQANFDQGMGPTGNGRIWRTNVQPVIPFSVNEDWNLISRTILPVIHQENVTGPGSFQFGLGDVVQSFFFSPKDPTSNGWVLGAGPVLLLPTGTEAALSGEKWGLGPTALALKQTGPWTIGTLVNHIATVGGNDLRNDVNATFVQPFVAYVTPTKTTISLNSESTYDWNSGQWAIPINLGAYQMLMLGDQPVQFGGGVRYWMDSPNGGPKGWGFRIQFTMLFPK